MDAVKTLKKEIFGEEEMKKKRKHPKGPNPLSVKKKKQLAKEEKVGPGTRTASGKRRRRKKTGAHQPAQKSAATADVSIAGS